MVFFICVIYLFESSHFFLLSQMKVLLILLIFFQDLYTTNYKTQMKEIKINRNRWKDISCSWSGKINIVQITMLPKAIYRFNAIPIKLLIPMAFSTELWQKISKFVWKHRSPQIANSVLGKKNGTGGINHPDFRLYHKATLIKTVWSWHKDRHTRPMEQDRKPRSKPLNLWAPYLWQNAIYNGEKKSPFAKWCWKN